MDTYRSKYRRVYTGLSVHTQVPELFPLQEPGSNDTPVAMSTPSTQILVSLTALWQKEHGSSEKWLAPRLEPETGKTEPAAS